MRSSSRSPARSWTEIREKQVAGGDDFAPVRVRVEPGIERGLRLFEQRNFAAAGLLRGFQRQIAGELVEGCGNGYQHVLLFERRVGMRLVPRAAQVTQIGGRGVDRGDLPHTFRGLPREHRGGAVRAGVR